jgi:hypothetical protein
MGPVTLSSTPAHVRFFFWDRSAPWGFVSLPSPLCAKTPKSKIPACLQNPVKGVAHARARVREIRFFDRPYNPRMQGQFSASGGKAVKLGPTNMPQVSSAPHSALLRVRGLRTDAGRSAHRSPSERFTSPRPPSTCAKTPKYRNPSFPKNLVKGVQHARARVLNPDFSPPPILRACESNTAQAEARP